MHTALFSFVIGAAFALTSTTSPAANPGPHDRSVEQRAAMAKLARMDGAWRGTATVHQPDGKRLELVQTERVGTLLDGGIRVIEGRGHDAQGIVRFNAFAILSYVPASSSYSLRSYAHGFQNDFRFELTDTGFVWSVPAGPATIRYTATIDGDTWTEIGERLVDGQAPVKTYEMRLTRIGDSDWPASGAVSLE